MRRRPRLDSTQRPIVEALQAAGCSVLSLAPLGGGVPDLLVGLAGRMLLLECKTKGERHRETRERQAAWATMWQGPHPVIVHSAEEALMACGLR